MIDKLMRRIQMMIGRCVLTAVGDTFQVNLLAGESHDDIELMQQYGFKSVPPKGSEGVTVSMNGNRDDTLIIATKDGTEISLDVGETAIFNKFDAIIKLDKSGNITISGGKVTFTGDSVELNGSSKKFVTYAELNTALQTFMTKLNAHTHVCASPGSPSAPLTPTITLDISSSATSTIVTGG